ncbi:hypothetical protein PHLGIDRAFT_129130 [Phlebiopsis gigantea 11061_1 CR5-6]|uniref:XLF-like N-terminal domain-containing protein n=1 Tax=Phlebiopsis gigantea (strain 11061_1 CR5-6) TaxID=745531 RepID=A0A0C3S810_PHLG1|nr:hypothetical protein PHLGIDRAFT_129130 [Phlebiopsis gigantea 11061_1 CR5-6]
MEYITEEHQSLLLNKEWLVKNDSVKSVPYLLKFHASTAKQTCCVMITDTKQVWGEVLSSKHISRRWKDCNPQSSPNPAHSDEVEDEWRLEILDLVSAAHTLGGSIDLSFEVIESRNADLAIELGSDDFKWRWEMYSLGPKVSADVLSQHLIMPLISVTHLAFSSSDPVSELSSSDLEQAVDKVARTARRSVDTHVKHAMTKPRVATSLSRMSAILNFVPDSPTVSTEVSTPEFKLPSANQPVAVSESRHIPAADRSRATQDGNVAALPDNEPSVNAPSHTPKPASVPPPRQEDDDDSVTEAETDEEQEAPQRSAIVESASCRSSPPVVSASGTANRPRQTSPKPAHKKAAPTAVDESSDSSPVRHKKKARRVESSSDSEDSEAERRRRLAARANATSSRGTKQPIKRGVRRF